MHDLIIENAQIVDGSGAPARSGSLAVDEGRIAPIGNDLGPARETVSCSTPTRRR
jgi:N-acyl-D-aspartate/D-glutamate deacylase